MDKLRERLSAKGLIDEFDRGVSADDMQALYQILKKTGMALDDVYAELIALSRGLNKDLREMIAERFRASDVLLAEELIRPYVEKHRSRVLKCAVYASRGDIEKLREMLNLAELDWRDVIMFGEYDIFEKKLVKLRDFS